MWFVFKHKIIKKKKKYDYQNQQDGLFENLFLTLFFIFKLKK